MAIDTTIRADEIVVERVHFDARDGFPLGGFLHSARSSQAPRMTIVFAPGGGVRAERYKHFLNALACHGIPSFALDYRGMGESRPRRLRGFVAGFEDWVEHDTGAAIDWMKARFPNARLVGMAHSIGCLLIGAPSNATRFSQLVLIAPHTGYQGDYAWRVRWRSQFALRIVGPPLEWVLGYFPGSLLGMGEDVPTRAAAQMAARTTPRIVEGVGGADPVRQVRLVDRIECLRLPALVLSFSDDPWATDSGVRRFLHAYRNLLIVRQVVVPTEIGRSGIGHWGFFRRSAASTLWPYVFQFLNSGASESAGYQ
jgi:predicted alpha/beta hydrolase